MITNWKGITGILGVAVVAAGIVIWLFYFNTPGPTEESPTPSFGVSDTRVTTSPGEDLTTNEELPLVSNTSAKKIFKVADGPIAGATLIETTRPTSTIARFVLATSGHTFDLLLDSQGAVPKAISNTTIPGVVSVAWSERGRGAILQYVDQDAVKTAHLALPPAGATTTSPVRIQFLPTGITSLAVSPDGASVAYLLRTEQGSDGYTARADGASARKAFSLPLSQIQLSWPSSASLLAATAPAATIAGVVFSINSTSGSVTPLVFGEGITATANRTFSHVVYQTAGAERASYAQNVRTGLARPLSFDPLPELCTWSLATSTTLYCATPLEYVPPNFIDILHLGFNQVPMSIVSFDVAQGRSKMVATPGSDDGGEGSDIAELSLSTNEKYLLFIRKGDRSLWAVRLNDE
jgi:hypothetical protein